jgi:hypothetical protein
MAQCSLKDLTLKHEEKTGRARLHRFVAAKRQAELVFSMQKSNWIRHLFIARNRNGRRCFHPAISAVIIMRMLKAYFVTIFSIETENNDVFRMTLTCAYAPLW